MLRDLESCSKDRAEPRSSDEVAAVFRVAADTPLMLLVTSKVPLDA